MAHKNYMHFDDNKFIMCGDNGYYCTIHPLVDVVTKELQWHWRICTDDDVSLVSEGFSENANQAELAIDNHIKMVKESLQEKKKVLDGYKAYMAKPNFVMRFVFPFVISVWFASKILSLTKFGFIDLNTFPFDPWTWVFIFIVLLLSLLLSFAVFYAIYERVGELRAKEKYYEARFAELLEDSKERSCDE